MWKGVSAERRERRQRPHCAGLPRGPFCGVLSSRHGMGNGGSGGRTLPGSSWRRSRARTPRGTSVRGVPVGVPLAGVPRVSSQMSSGNPAPGSRSLADPGARRAAHWHSAHTGLGAARCVSSRVVRLDDSGSPATRVAFRGATAGLQRPGPHFMPEKPMRRLKTLSNSNRKILSRDLYLQKA